MGLIPFSWQRIYSDCVPHWLACNITYGVDDEVEVMENKRRRDKQENTFDSHTTGRISIMTFAKLLDDLENSAESGLRKLLKREAHSLQGFCISIYTRAKMRCGATNVKPNPGPSSKSQDALFLHFLILYTE